MKKLQIQRQLREVRMALAGLSSWRVKGAILVAALGVVALVILAASRPADGVVTTAAMEPGFEEQAPSASAPRKARATKNAAAVRPVSNPAPSAEPAESSAGAGDESSVVTITGCLEQDDDVFRLKDTDGFAAPKARSWKSGFLKKKSAKVEVIDASNRLRLKNHVGHRVSVTGQLYEREMLANSVRRVSASCN